MAATASLNVWNSTAEQEFLPELCRALSDYVI